ncbi:MAG: DUF2062 domain-containing protein [Candidatus Brocadiia bacterium]
MRKQRQVARALKDTFVHRVLGEHIFGARLWGPHRRAVANGLALGLFIAFTPTIPFQMLLAVAGAVVLKVNLPAAVVGVWVTNPFTAVPIYLTANRLGKHILLDTWLLELVQDVFLPAGRSGAFLNQALFLWTGSLFMAGISALLGWATVHLLWALLE